MIDVEDFTILTAGTEVPVEGPVGTCPRCGRNGIEHRLDAAVSFFVHRQSSELMCDGFLVDPYDLCYLERALVS